MSYLLISLIILAYILPFVIVLRSGRFLDRNTWFTVVAGYTVANLADAILIVAAYTVQLNSQPIVSLSQFYNSLFAALCIFLPRMLLAVYFYIRCYNSFKKYKHFKPYLDTNGLYLNSQIFFALTILFWSLWIYHSDWYALTDPRTAYQLHRKNIGFIWALFITFAIMWYATCLIQDKKISILSVLLFMFMMYTSGSKQVLVGSCIILCLQPFMSPKIRAFILPVGAIFSLFLFLVLFGQFSTSISLYTRLFNYLQTTGLASMVFDLYASSELEYYYGEIYISSFWSYIPRILYPDKPFEYGSTFLLGEFFPGMAQTGATPSFGYAIFFADFGWFGAFLTLLNFKLVIQMWALRILTNDTQSRYKAPAFAIILFPFYSFHVPILLSLVLHAIICKTKVKKIRLKYS